MQDQPAEPPDAEERVDIVKSTLNFPVVGIGASAGGLAALLRFFEQMPSASGMAFVIILHLSPKHESNAAAILQRVTRMPVRQVLEPTPIEADHIYVIPPTHDLSMSDGYLRLTEPTRTRGSHVAIDLFFRTLAQVHEERAICIVMSGTGADGAVGLARIKERGGVTMAQAPDDADHDGMPRAAIATGMVDFVMSAVDMPQQLLDFWANASRIRLPDGRDAPRVEPSESLEAAREAEDALRDIMALLRSYSRNDFRHYKRATVLRRIERRLQVRALPDLPAYRDYLREHPEEARPLLQDMLISVTNFFRDRDAFDALERDVLPALLEGRSPDEGLRIWVAGCATGEEAYSVGMLLREQTDGKALAPDFQIFATDIDENAITLGRAGLYPEAIATDVAPSRVRQFFSKEQNQYRVAKYVREKVLFALHNVLRDPPFSRLDLICCRNLLIYLDRDAQTRILEMFRFALKPGGYLFLGTSESADAAPNLFTIFDKKNRIYRTNPHATAARHLPLIVESSLDRIVPARFKENRRESQQLSFAELHQRYIGRIVSPSVLIDERHNVLHLSENVGQFLLHGSGTPSLNLLSNVQNELRTELRTALFQSAQNGEMVQTRVVSLTRGNAAMFVRMTVRQFQEGPGEPSLALVMFDELPDDQQGVAARDTDPAHQIIINQLEAEIRQLKDHLQETIEHAETSTEELKASNEELQAINEELRSASEELETSKEELQSINEELTTVNFELKVKVDETSKINDDLQNLIASSDIATVFIDRGMRIKRYTPQAVSIFNLIASDLDRSLLDITHRLDYELLAQDASDVFKTLGVSERQVASSDGRHYLARIRPYRTTDDRIDGAVLTFIDVTALRRAEESLRAGEERLRIAAETTRDYAIITIDDDGLINSWNLGAERIFGYLEHEILGRHIELIFTPEDRASGAPGREIEGARESGRSEDERWHQRKDGTTFFCSGVMTVMDGKSRGFAKIARDMTENKRLQASREELLVREQAANELKDKFLAVMSHELKHPLNLIQVNAELLVSQPEVKALPSVSRAGEVIQRAVASQAKIIDDLLDLSRARTGKLTLKLEAVRLDELVSAIASAAQESVAQKDQTLTLAMKPEGVLALCDRVRTEQICWNVINNAIKFTPAGGTIHVSLAQRSGFAVFTVADTGPGISPEFLPHVFDMFRQAPQQPGQPNTGLGVGLAMVRDLAEAQGGNVFAESPGLGQGASFSVRLPLDDRKLTGDVPAQQVQALKGLRVLAIDDMRDALEPFAALLRLEGALVETALDGPEGLRLLEAGHFDLLISDLGMAPMDGYELIREVRQRDGLQQLPALALSGYGRTVDVSRALASGFDGHLSKPATLAQIRVAVAKLPLKRPPLPTPD
ncbi:MAG: PAS domain S-box protein [Comamonadaceae bacterium]|nr:MAG: PAS domain S-box protein [Comamonadaceae bacterium]